MRLVLRGGPLAFSGTYATPPQKKEHRLLTRVISGAIIQGVRSGDQVRETKITPKQWIEVLKWKIRAIRSGLRLQEIRARVRAQKERAA